MHIRRTTDDDYPIRVDPERRIADAKPLPDLIVVDGGKGQLSSAHTALTSLNLADRPLISIAKRFSYDDL